MALAPRLTSCHLCYCRHDEDPDLISYCETVHDSLQNERILSRWTNLLAEKLAEAAYLKSRSKGIPSPFQVQAEKAGHLFQVRTVLGG